ncbi:MAG: hypothetical protein U1D55_16515 [Phycisphaerae bacterium]
MLSGRALKSASFKRFAGVAVGSLLSASALAEDGKDHRIVRVEEDWGLVLNDPESELYSPQFHTIMSPTEGLDSLYGQVLWNYSESPDFSPGGLQLSFWNDNDLLLDRTASAAPLSQRAEVIIWTQVMELSGSTVTFSIQDGNSESWGQFGGSEMTVSYDSHESDLNRYSTGASVSNSCITYGGNRVALLAILQVRRFDEHGNVDVDSTPHVVAAAASGQGE